MDTYCPSIPLAYRPCVERMPLADAKRMIDAYNEWAARFRAEEVNCIRSLHYFAPNEPGCRATTRRVMPLFARRSGTTARWASENWRSRRSSFYRDWCMKGLGA